MSVTDTIGRYVRLAAGLTLLAAALFATGGFFGPLNIRIGAGILGAALIVSTAFGFCSIRRLFGILTCRG